MRIVVCDYDPTWPSAFEREAPCLRAALGGNAEAVEHVGSTAVPGLAAKPVIDILIGVRALDAVDQCTSQMAALGYEAKGEYGFPGRRYFRKHAPDGTRSHHVHIYLRSSRDFHRHLVFRDFLRAHPDRAAEYGALKQAIAAEGVRDRKAYVAAKAEFAAALERDALAWQAGRMRS